MRRELLMRVSARASLLGSDEPLSLVTASECLWSGIVAGKSPSGGPVPDGDSLGIWFSVRRGIGEDPTKSGAGPLELFKEGLFMDKCLCTGGSFATTLKEKGSRY